MPPRTKAEKLFGAACLKVGLERGGSSDAAATEIFLGALEDLGLRESEVDAFLSEHRKDVELAWQRQDAARKGLRHD